MRQAIKIIFFLCLLFLNYGHAFDRLSKISPGTILGKDRPVPWLVSVKTLYKSQRSNDSVEVEGLGTLVKYSSKSNALGCFVLTASHLVGGRITSLETQTGRALEIIDHIVDPIEDIAFVRVDCPHEDFEMPINRNGGSYFFIESSDYYRQEDTDALNMTIGFGGFTPVLAKNVSSIEPYTSKSKDTADGTDVSAAMRDHTYGGIEIYSRLVPGQSGAPLIWFVNKGQALKVTGLAKSINRFFKKTQFTEIPLNLFEKYEKGVRGNINDAYWIYDGDLTRMSFQGIRESKIIFQPTGDFIKGPIGNSTSVEKQTKGYVLPGIEVKGENIVAYRRQVTGRKDLGSWQYAEFEQFMKDASKGSNAELLKLADFNLKKQMLETRGRSKDTYLSSSPRSCRVQFIGDTAHVVFQIPTSINNEKFRFELNPQGGLDQQTFVPIIQTTGSQGSRVIIDLRRFVFPTGATAHFLSVQDLKGVQSSLLCTVEG